MPEDNKRETGVRRYKFDTREGPEAEFSQEAAENEKPKGGFGLTRPVDRSEAETRQSDGVEPGTKVEVRKAERSRPKGASQDGG